MSELTLVSHHLDPWDGRTLEWSTSSPPPPYDFDEIPQVKYRDDFWFTKYPETISEYYGHDEDQAVPSGAQLDIETEDDLTTGSQGAGDHGDEDGHGGGHAIHLPDMSYYPFILAIGIAILATGFLTHFSVFLVGAPFFIWGMLGWAMEPVNDPE